MEVELTAWEAPHEAQQCLVRSTALGDRLWYLADALRVDLEAPMLLTAAFLRATAAWPVPRKVLNISSGLGRRPMASQAAYCAAKAGMDHFTRCVALEEARERNGAKVCSLAPGVIDTDMQVQLRGADPTAFPDRDRFAGLKVAGQLSTPSEAATRVLAYLARPDFGAEPGDSVICHVCMPQARAGWISLSWRSPITIVSAALMLRASRRASRI